jgi:hypothetical protein
MTQMAATTKYWALPRDSRDIHFAFGCYLFCALVMSGVGGLGYNDLSAFCGSEPMRRGSSIFSRK